MSTSKDITDLEQAEAYFYRWECNKHQMSRDCDEYFNSYRKIATSELENQWIQKEFERSVSYLKILNSTNISVQTKYSKIIELLSNKRQTNDDIIQLLDATKNIKNSTSNSARIYIVDVIIKKIIPIARRLNLLDESREFLKLSEVLLVANDDNGHFDTKIREEVNQCVNSLKEISTIDQAKVYFIQHSCSRDRMKYDFKNIADSYFNFGAENFEKQWIQEAFEQNIRSIQNGDYRAMDFPFYSETVYLFVSGICSVSNSKILLNATKNIKKLTRDYFYFKYAREILEYVIPALVELGVTNEVREFLQLAEDLIYSNSPISRDWLWDDTLKKYNEWMEKSSSMKNNNNIQDEKEMRIIYFPSMSIILTVLASCDLISIKWIRYLILTVSMALLLFTLAFLLLSESRLKKKSDYF